MASKLFLRSLSLQSVFFLYSRVHCIDIFHAHKRVSQWDHYTHTYPEKIVDYSNEDIACDSYHNYKDDIQLIKQMGMDYYRFSFSWTRILPTGYSNIISNDDIQYYHNLLDKMEKYSIKPLVTVYHWNHPWSYVNGLFAPGLKIRNHAAYLCAENVVKAHTRPYHKYEEEFRAKQNGKVGIVIGIRNYWPKKKDGKDIERCWNSVFSKEGEL
ncbi:myrosinase 1-like [Phymastichus coffea]|uniref:myrosinase 1-like n=1 Tax=Phymastichus coffea TaxID=108790 RepID=UPI00273B94CB|nr:myrosinase 1-like [Phymastichus coffea]